MSTTNNANLIIDLCTQRRRRAFFNIPPNRLELQPSPYGAHTKRDLDMRRKAEVLKYSSNAQSTQTNSFTKSEKYAQLINGLYQKRTYSNLFLDNLRNKTITCGINDIVLKPTSSSDVPGPIEYLYEDPAVPLYNYSTNVDAYAMLPPDGVLTYNLYYSPYAFFVSPMDVASLPPTDISNNTLYSVYFKQSDIVSYTFNANTPLSIYITGDASSNVNTYKANIQMTATITNVKSSVYYNSTLLSSTQISNPALTSIVFDISNNGSFSALQYIGNIPITNRLESSLGFVYDIIITFTVKIQYSITANGSTNTDLSYYLNYLNAGIYANITTPTTSSTNCRITSSQASSFTTFNATSSPPVSSSIVVLSNGLPIVL